MYMVRYLFRSIFIFFKKCCPPFLFANLKTLYIFCNAVLFCQRNKNKLCVALNLGGGIGDFIFFQTWLKEFSKHIGFDVEFYIFGGKTAELVFKNFPFVKKVFDEGLFKFFYACDLKLKLRHYPKVLFFNKYRVSKKFPIVQQFVLDCSEIVQTYGHILDHEPLYDGLWADIMVKKGFSRKTELFIGNTIFPFKRDLYCSFAIAEKDFDILEKFSLIENKFITLHNGSNTNNIKTNSDRYMCNYPEKLFSEFCYLFKERYPNIKIVQIGHPKSSKLLGGVDINLIGETSVMEAFAVLSRGSVHVDGDSGFVHANASMMGNSVVYYGPTPVDYLKYDSNINIYNNTCKPCMWDSPLWFFTCLAGHQEPLCLSSISPIQLLTACAQFIELNKAKDFVACDIDACCLDILEKNDARYSIAIFGYDHICFLDKFQNSKFTFYLDVCSMNENAIFDLLQANIYNSCIFFEFVTGYSLPASKACYDLIIVNEGMQFKDALFQSSYKKAIKNNGLIVYCDQYGNVKKIFRAKEKDCNSLILPCD